MIANQGQDFKEKFQKLIIMTIVVMNRAIGAGVEGKRGMCVPRQKLSATLKVH